MAAPRASSQPLASIYDEDDGHEQSINNADSAKNDGSSATGVSAAKPKFTPTIPSARRKKTEPEPSSEKPASFASDTKPSRPYTRNSKPQPLAAASAASGPLALGPSASITAANRARNSSSLHSEGLSAVRRIGSTNSLGSGPAQEADLFNDFLLVEEVFAREPLDTLHPVAVAPCSEDAVIDRKLDRNGLFLFQLPPILPPLADPPASNDAPVEDPNDPVGVLAALQRSMDSAEHWPRTVKGRMGKFRRYTSGRMTLTIGGVEFEVRPSVLDPTSAHLAAAVIDPEARSLANLGQINGGHFHCFLDLSHTE